MPDTYSCLLRCEEQTICFYSKKYSISKPLLYTFNFFYISSSNQDSFHTKNWCLVINLKLRVIQIQLPIRTGRWEMQKGPQIVICPNDQPLLYSDNVFSKTPRTLSLTHYSCFFYGLTWAIFLSWWCAWASIIWGDG